MLYRNININDLTTVEQVENNLPKMSDLFKISRFFREWHGKEIASKKIYTNNKRVRNYLLPKTHEDYENHHLMMVDYIQLKKYDTETFEKLLKSGIQFISQNMLFTIKSGKTKRHSKVLQIDNFGTHRKDLFETITVPMNAKGLETLKRLKVRKEYERVFKNFR